MNSDESIAVYIDGDNSSYKNIEIILNEIKSYGRIIILKVYGDWSEVNMKNWLTTASTYGIIPIQCERINGKNSTDIKMCVDLMRDLYNIENISLFYIVTSDSDYRHVISEIKTKILELKDLSGEELLNEIFNDRPTVIKKNIRRVIPTVNLQI